MAIVYHLKLITIAIKMKTIDSSQKVIQVNICMILNIKFNKESKLYNFWLDQKIQLNIKNKIILAKTKVILKLWQIQDQR